MSITNKIEIGWVNHVDLPCTIGTGNPPFQKRIETKQDLLRTIYLNVDKDIYVSVHNIEKRKENIFNKVYFDFDMLDEDDNLEPVFAEALTFALIFEYGKMPYRCYFSGSKGFSFYIDFEDTKIDDYRHTVQKFIYFMKDKLQLRRFDVGVCTDKNRISRLPYTINTKSGNFCRPIDIFSFSLDDQKQPINQSFLEVNRDISTFNKTLLNLDYEIPEENDVSLPSRSDIRNELNYILNSAKNIKNGRKNLIWRCIIPAMAVNGANDKQILDTLEKYLIDVYGNTGEMSYCKAQLQSYRNRTKEKLIYPTSLDKFRTLYELEGI